MLFRLEASQVGIGTILHMKMSSCPQYTSSYRMDTTCPAYLLTGTEPDNAGSGAMQKSTCSRAKWQVEAFYGLHCRTEQALKKGVSWHRFGKSALRQDSTSSGFSGFHDSAASMSPHETKIYPARSTGERSGKPVLAVCTADWTLSCEELSDYPQVSANLVLQLCRRKDRLLRGSSVCRQRSEVLCDIAGLVNGDGSGHSSNGGSGSGRSRGSSGGRRALHPAPEPAEPLANQAQHGMGALPEDSDVIGEQQVGQSSMQLLILKDGLHACDHCAKQLQHAESHGED